MTEDVPVTQHAEEQNTASSETVPAPNNDAANNESVTAKQERLNSGSHFKKSSENSSYYGSYHFHDHSSIVNGVSHSINVKAAAAAIDAVAAAAAEKARREFSEGVRRRKAEAEKLNQAQAKAEGEAKPEAKAKAEAETETKTETETAEASTATPENVPESLSATMAIAQHLKIKKPQRATEQAKSDSNEPSNPLENPASQGVQVETTPKVPRPRTPIAPMTPASKSGPHTILDPNVVTVSKIIDRVHSVPGINDPYEFKYPETFESPDPHYRRERTKYTYGPTFLLQFKDKLRVYPDPKWVQEVKSRIVIPSGMSRFNRSRSLRSTSSGSSVASSASGGSSLDFRSASMRSEYSGIGSRASSRKRSMRDDRRSNRSYTGRGRDRERRDRDRLAEDRKKEIVNGGEQTSEAPKVEEVAPLVPSANRWVPKFRQKKSTEKKLAPDGVTELLDKEEVERKMKSLLNKLTLEKFEPISSDILKIANQSKWETDGETLRTVIEQIFLKACDEPHWSSMYAQLCGKIVKDIDSEVKDESNGGKTGPKLVLHYLVVRCHTEFEKGWTDKLPTNPDGSPLEPEMMSDEYYQAVAAKRRGLGLVRFIGFLYRLNLLTANMMFECFRKLMKELNDEPSEEILESVSELLNTVGGQFETEKYSGGSGVLEGSALLDVLFKRLHELIDAGKISSRVRFKLMDVTELREDKNWVSDKKDLGPKTIQQIHQEEEAQRISRMGSRASSLSSSRRGNPSNRSRREPIPPPRDRDNFTMTKSYSQRGSQRASYRAAPQPVETKPAPEVAVNRFSALMDHDDDE